MWQNDSMPWQYSQSQGIISRNGQVILGGGYAGNGLGLNNPGAQDQHDVGPLPQGHYLMTALVDSPKTGIATINSLTRTPARKCTRFLLSESMGDNGRDDQSSSDGCIVAATPLTGKPIWATQDHALAL